MQFMPRYQQNGMSQDKSQCSVTACQQAKSADHGGELIILQHGYVSQLLHQVDVWQMLNLAKPPDNGGHMRCPASMPTQLTSMLRCMLLILQTSLVLWQRQFVSKGL